MDGDLVVTFDEVDFREDPASGEAGREVLDMRNGVGVAGSALVQPAVVTAGPDGPVLFGDHMQAGAPRGVGTAADARGAHEVEVSFGCGKSVGSQSPRRCLDRRAGRVDETLDAVARHAGR